MYKFLPSSHHMVVQERYVNASPNTNVYRRSTWQLTACWLGFKGKVKSLYQLTGLHFVHSKTWKPETFSWLTVCDVSKETRNKFIIIAFLNVLSSGKSRDGSVGITLGYGLDERGSRVRFPTGAGNSSLHHRVQTSSGAHPASYPMCTRGSFLGVKRPGREADHSPPSSADVKNAWSYTSIPPIRLHGVVLS
jgi:hypothetical protein